MTTDVVRVSFDRLLLRASLWLALLAAFMGLFAGIVARRESPEATVLGQALCVLIVMVTFSGLNWNVTRMAFRHLVVVPPTARITLARSAGWVAAEMTIFMALWWLGYSKFTTNHVLGHNPTFDRLVTVCNWWGCYYVVVAGLTGMTLTQRALLQKFKELIREAG